MARFDDLWVRHPGQGDVCDSQVFENQCAMRMGQAARDVGIDLANRGLRTCVKVEQLPCFVLPRHRARREKLYGVAHFGDS